jgi:heme/copper-type cytochrome/quinol oxidase subunit 2
VAVPNQGDKSAPTDVAVPQVQAPASQTSGSQYRSFNITVRDGVYSPATVAVNSGDVVDLEISAVGAAYGFTQPDYGFNASIPAGATQRIQFQAANAGKFTFYCAACGGPSKGPVGYLIVK